MKKLIELIKKLLGSSSSSSSDSSSSSGFTLVELLIVIAVIGILAAALLVAIDPVDKIRAGNDSKVQSDVRQIYDAALRAYAQGNILPATITGASNSIISSGELKSAPVPPATYGATYEYFVNGAGTDVVACGRLMSKAQVNKAIATVPAATSSNLRIVVNNGKTCFTAAACGAANTCP